MPAISTAGFPLISPSRSNLSLNLSFNDLLGFQANPGANSPATSVPFSGSGSTWLNIYTASGNVNYEIPIDKISWVEPTVGLAYAISSYGPGADQFALADGSVTRLQAGARFGVEGAWDGMRMTTIVTGLLWDNVSVAGGVFANAANPLILADQRSFRLRKSLRSTFINPMAYPIFYWLTSRVEEACSLSGRKQVCALPGENERILFASRLIRFKVDFVIPHVCILADLKRRSCAASRSCSGRDRRSRNGGILRSFGMCLGPEPETFFTIVAGRKRVT